MHQTRKKNHRSLRAGVTTITGFLCVALTAGNTAWAQKNISVVVNGQTVTFSGAGATMEKGRVLVPLRGVFEKLGASVEFSDTSRTIKALRGDSDIELTLGSRKASVDKKEITLDTPAVSADGTVLMPLRFIGENLGAKVSYDAPTRTVRVDADKAVRTESSASPSAIPSTTASASPETGGGSASGTMIAPPGPPSASVDTLPSTAPGAEVSVSPSPSPSASLSPSPTASVEATPVPPASGTAEIRRTPRIAPAVNTATADTGIDWSRWLPWILGALVLLGLLAYLLTRRRGGQVIAAKNDKKSS